MRAVRLHTTEDLRVEEIEEPTPGPGQVKLRNAYAGICGSDLHVYSLPRPPGMGTPHPLTGATRPQVLGHEFSGTVVELGPDVTGVSVGDRVAVFPVYSCGTCTACRRGRINACRRIGFHGLTSHGGGMAAYTVVPASMLHVLPASVDLRLGALVEPMAVAWRAVRAGGVQPGETALVAGAGPIGIGLWFALRAHGVETVVVAEPSPERRAAIERLGGPHVVDPDGLPAVLAGLAPDGVDVVFDAAGVPAALTTGLDALVSGGRLVVVATHGRPVEMETNRLQMRELSLVGSLAYLPEDFDAVIAAMADGRYDATGWVEEVGLDDVERAFADLHAGRRMKVLVRSGG
ncbi:2,3-butanediol dehydrogenase [Trujillonella endophytica]|uniref:(R,R)-butanediol dehydrogenase / meso-butanediol dehydrogenase / diacetyl reductase n=1 Tax=Trujillonella endophytica TaxID=673521 RepID=A0A1H8Q4K1_9ACTN|nr:2,3-butanediol dehydrogenase [Trujillella endophytica]SEO49182.1 (R,R)-butanediol dehydrogenase / meso-butanediol dehydrogenase / diacetyl reductase [Trujillella endophytica]